MPRSRPTTPIIAIPKEKDNFTFSPEQLKAIITPKTKLIILNFPSNPTGGVTSRQQLEQIAQVILSSCSPNVRVYSDEIYENILFNKHPHCSIASVPGMEKITLIASGFSKSSAWTGGRIGYIVTPTVEEADLFKNLNINYFSCISPYNQEGARTALEHPESKGWVANMSATFENRCKKIIPLLNGIEGITCQAPGGAFYAFPNIAGLCENLGVFEAFDSLPRGTQDKTTISTLFQMFALYHHGVAVLDRPSFGTIGSKNMHFLRLSLASDLKVLNQGVERLKTAGRDEKGFRRFIEKGEHLF